VREEGWAEIQSGLTVGETVVRGHADSLQEGQKIEFAVAGDPSHITSGSQEPSNKAVGNGPDWLKIQSLDAWIADLQSSDPKVKKMAELAMTELGTNALPGILKFLNESTDQAGEADSRRLNFAEAVQYMGPEVKIALPEFTALLKSGQQEKAYSGARALAFSAVAVPEAFSILTQALSDTSAGARDAACHGIGFCLTFQTNAFAEPALPLLVRKLKDPVDYVRSDAAAALAQYTQHVCQRGQPELDFLIPPLIELLHDKYSFARQHAAWALSCSCFREKLQPWLPAIQNLQDDPDEGVRREVATLLQFVK
jgi:HEAT repeat protein